jgi:hypothetical protein
MSQPGGGFRFFGSQGAILGIARQLFDIETGAAVRALD